MDTDSYILQTDARAAQRLMLQNEVYGPSSKESLRRAGVRRGMLWSTWGAEPAS
jgi:hypothetical protein